MECARRESMVSASKTPWRNRALLFQVAAWRSRKLSAAVVLGLALIALLPEEMPPFLAAASPPVPVEMVRTLPVPYLEATKPASMSPAPPRSSREAPAKILQVVAQRSRARRQARREPESGALGKAGQSSGKGADKVAAAVPAEPADAKGDTSKGDAKKTDPKADRRRRPSRPSPTSGRTPRSSPRCATACAGWRRSAPRSRLPSPSGRSGAAPRRPSC